MPKPADWRPILAQWAGEEDQTHREHRFQEWLLEVLRRDFLVKREVEGTYLRKKEARRIDFLCKPRPHLLFMGFPPLIFGIEAKYVLGWEDDKRFMSRWIAQMNRYLHSQFPTQKGLVYPDFILSAPPISEVIDPTQRTEWIEGGWVQRIGHQIGLGELYFRPRCYYDPPRDLRDEEYTVLLEIRFDGWWWNNTRPQMGLFPGKNICDPKFNRKGDGDGSTPL